MDNPIIKKFPYEINPRLYPNLPIRKKEPDKLTTITGVLGKDGIVIITDAQETREETRSVVTKTDEIGEDCLFAGATNDTNFLMDFEQLYLEPCVAGAHEELEDLNFKSRLDLAITRYDDWIDSQYGNSSQRRYDEMYTRSMIQGVLARRYRIGLDETAKVHFDLYEINNHSVTQKVKKPRVTATAGSGGRYARLLFESGKNLLDKIEWNWNLFSTSFLMQFCYLFVGRVILYDSHSLGTDTWLLTENERIGSVTDKRIWGNQRKKEGDELKQRLSILLDSFVQEIGKKKLLELILTYDVLDLLEKNVKNKELSEQIKTFFLQELGEN